MGAKNKTKWRQQVIGSVPVIQKPGVVVIIRDRRPGVPLTLNSDDAAAQKLSGWLYGGQNDGCKKKVHKYEFETPPVDNLLTRKTKFAN